jgi:hypothetical protein
MEATFVQVFMCLSPFARAPMATGKLNMGRVGGYVHSPTPRCSRASACFPLGVDIHVTQRQVCSALFTIEDIDS